VEEAVEPFEAGALDPTGGLRLGAGEEVEGGADADQDRAAEASDVIGHPELLAWGAKPDPDDIGAGGKHALYGGFILSESEGTEGRRFEAHDLQAGEAGAEDLCQPLGNTFSTAVEVVPPAAGEPILAGSQHEVGAVDAPDVCVAVGAQQPDEGHAIRGGEAAIVEDGLKVGIVVCFQHRMRGTDANILRGVRANECFQRFQSLSHMNRADLRPNNATASRKHWIFDGVRGLAWCYHKWSEKEIGKCIGLGLVDLL
jgi:hypothetical protein